MPTDKIILMKGLKYMGWALPMFFIGPVVLHTTFKNQEHILFIPVLGMGIIICLLAIFFMFKGLRTIMSSMID